MRSFFTQFGDIRGLKLSRSRKTARSKGYCFIEFEDLDTAKIVADSMNNYMMFGQTIKAHVVEQEKIHPQLFEGVRETTEFRKMPHKAISAEAQNRVRTVSADKKRREKLVKKEEKKRELLAAKGITYQFPGYKADTTESAIATAEEVESFKQQKIYVAKLKRQGKKIPVDVEQATKDNLERKNKKKAAAAASESESASSKKKKSPALAPTPAPVAAATASKTPKKAAAEKAEPAAAASAKKTPAAKKKAAPESTSPAPSAKKAKK